MQVEDDVVYKELTPQEQDNKEFQLCSDALDIYDIKRRSVAGAMISAKSVARDLDIDEITDACYMVSGLNVATNTLTETRNAFQAIVGTIVGLDIKRINEEADQDYMATIRAVAKSQHIPAGYEHLRLNDSIWEKKYKVVVDERELDAYTESCQVKSGYDDGDESAEVETTWPAESGSGGGKEVDVDSKKQPRYDESMSEVVNNHSKPNPNVKDRRNTMKTATAKNVARKTAAATVAKVKAPKAAAVVEQKGPSKLEQAYQMVAANFKEANKKRGARPLTRASMIRHLADQLGISDTCASTYYHNSSQRFEQEVGPRPALPREPRQTAE